jgi:hypothetical protein
MLSLANDLMLIKVQQLYKTPARSRQTRDTKRRDLIGHALTKPGLNSVSYSPLSALAPHMMLLAACPLAPHMMLLLQMLENPEDVLAPHMIELPHKPLAPHMMEEPLEVFAPHMIELPVNWELPQTAGPDQVCEAPHIDEGSLVRRTFPVLES